MELYKNTADAFVNYLKRHGYPDESISVEWGTPQCSIDIAVLANDLITPIAIFEIKGRKTRDAIDRGISQLKRAVHFFDITVPCNLVFASDNNVEFEVVDVTGNVYNNEEIDYSFLLTPQPLKKPVSYNNLQAGSTGKILSKTIRKKQKRIDRIKWVCWLLFPIVAIAILVLDAIDVYHITALRLAVVGAIIIIVLIPFFSEISIKEISFKRKDCN